MTKCLNMQGHCQTILLMNTNNLAIKCAEKTGFDYEWLKRNGTMWTTMRDIFQTWFLGDELFEKTFGYIPINTGKTGLLYKEEPIVDKNKLITIMSLLNRNNACVQVRADRI